MPGGMMKTRKLSFVEYLRTLYTSRPVDLIVAIGAPAANFVQRYRQRLFPTTPMVFTAVEQRRVQYEKLTENDTVVAVAHDFPAAFENILRVLPLTKTIAIVNGASSTGDKCSAGDGSARAICLRAAPLFFREPTVWERYSWQIASISRGYSDTGRAYLDPAKVSIVGVNWPKCSRGSAWQNLPMSTASRPLAN
jgi:hypothetical protein